MSHFYFRIESLDPDFFAEQLRLFLQKNHFEEVQIRTVQQAASGHNKAVDMATASVVLSVVATVITFLNFRSNQQEFTLAQKFADREIFNALIDLSRQGEKQGHLLYLMQDNNLTLRKVHDYSVEQLQEKLSCH